MNTTIVAAALTLALSASPAFAQSTQDKPARKAPAQAAQSVPETDSQRFQRQLRVEEHGKLEQFGPPKPQPMPEGRKKSQPAR